MAINKKKEKDDKAIICVGKIIFIPDGVVAVSSEQLAKNPEVRHIFAMPKWGPSHYGADGHCPNPTCAGNL